MSVLINTISKPQKVIYAVIQFSTQFPASSSRIAKRELSLIAVLFCCASIRTGFVYNGPDRSTSAL